MKAPEEHINPILQSNQTEPKAERPRKAAAVKEGETEVKETAKEPKEKSKAAAERKEKKSKGKSIVVFISEFFLSIINGTFLTKDNMLKSVPYFFFLTFLAIIYIANTYYAEKMVRITDRTKHDLKELRYEHITTKSQLMLLSKQSEVLKRLIGTGLKESVVPPEKIFIKTDQVNTDKNKVYWLPIIGEE